MEKEDKVNIVFLDVDGVLNCSKTEDSCGGYKGIEDKKVALLKQIVDASKAKIVLVSTWKMNWYKNPKYKHRQDVFANYLDAKLAKQGLSIIDKTSEYFMGDRGLGIVLYLNQIKVLGINVHKYVILDDLLFDYKKVGLYDKLIKTSFLRGGLNQRHALKAIDMLS